MFIQHIENKDLISFINILSKADRLSVITIFNMHLVWGVLFMPEFFTRLSHKCKKFQKELRNMKFLLVHEIIITVFKSYI